MVFLLIQSVVKIAKKKPVAVTFSDEKLTPIVFVSQFEQGLALRRKDITNQTNKNKKDFALCHWLSWASHSERWRLKRHAHQKIQWSLFANSGCCKNCKQKSVAVIFSDEKMALIVFVSQCEHCFAVWKDIFLLSQEMSEISDDQCSVPAFTSCWQMTSHLTFDCQFVLRQLNDF